LDGVLLTKKMTGDLLDAFVTLRCAQGRLFVTFVSFVVKS
jgi:hypothetical protein